MFKFLILVISLSFAITAQADVAQIFDRAGLSDQLACSDCYSVDDNQPSAFASLDDASDSDTSHSAIVKVPLPPSALMFGSALTGWLFISSRRQRLKVLLPVKSLPILGLSFPNQNYQETLATFQGWINDRQPHQVFVANVHTVVSCRSDTELKNISQHSLNVMDGLPLVWYARIVLNAKQASRVCGPDLMLQCLDRGRNVGWKHFFLGGSPEVLTDLVRKMQLRYPGVDIVGHHSPPFRALTIAEDTALVNYINACQPDFLWVGLGAPKQEKWIAAHLDRIHVPVQLGVGAAFNFHSGHVQRAPIWMQKSGLEWIFRMSKEKRLIQRYLETNPVFLRHFIKDLLSVWLMNRKIS